MNRTAMRYSLFLLVLLYIMADAAHAQSLITPLWEHQYNSSGTRIAFDGSSDLLYRAATTDPMAGHFDVQVFTIDGADLTPPEALQFHGVYTLADYTTNEISRLTADQDTLHAVMRYIKEFEPDKNVSWTISMPVNGSKGTLFGSGATRMLDAHHDQLGTLVLLDDELRGYGTTGWTTGSVAVAGAQRMAITEHRAFCGAPPSLMVVDRDAMVLLPSIIVPSSGATAPAALIMNGDSVINYATTNSNNTMDIGALDMDGFLLWSKVITLPGSCRLTSVATDAAGNFWVSVTHSSGGTDHTGYLYGTNTSGAATDLYYFGRSIVDIASSGTRLFLTGGNEFSPISTYVIAFDPGVITSLNEVNKPSAILFPNPVRYIVTLQSVSSDVEQIRVIDAAGRSLKELTGPFSTTVNFSVADLAPGSYFVRIEGRAGSTTLPFQVSR